MGPNRNPHGTTSGLRVTLNSCNLSMMSLLTFLHILHYYGIQGELNSWIQNFLSNRKQAVVLEGEKSDYVAVESGVPHTRRMFFLNFLLQFLIIKKNLVKLRISF